MPFPIGQASMKIYLPNKKLFFSRMTGQDFPKPCMFNRINLYNNAERCLSQTHVLWKEKKTCQWAHASTANREFHHDFS